VQLALAMFTFLSTVISRYVYDVVIEKIISHVCNVLELYQRIDVIYYYKNNSVFCKFIRVYNRNKQTTHK